MKSFTFKEIELGTGGKLIRGSYAGEAQGVSIDTRIIKPQQMFFAIKGNQTDGHNYLQMAIDKGCKAFVISDESKLPDAEGINVVLVEDTTLALQSLAKYYLKQLKVKKVAVTGSVGKTSTRDMVYYILKEKYKAGRNEGNLNSEYGVAMTILSFDEDLEAIVLEIGMDHFGEIDKLVHLIEPDVGIITNVGVSHIENLGSREGILKAKMEITNCFDRDNLLIVNSSCDMLTRENTEGNYRLRTVGNTNDSSAVISNVMDYGDEGIEYSLKKDDNTYQVRLFVPGSHNAINSGLAIEAGVEMGISVSDCIKGLQSMELTGKRLNIMEAHGIRVIDDTYNACPDSMKSAARTLVATGAKRRIAILGDMYELGNDSPAYHYNVGEFVGNLNIDIIIAVGENAEEIAKGAKKVQSLKSVLYFKSKEELTKQLKDMVKKDDLILVKGSRGMTMETIVEEILKIYE